MAAFWFVVGSFCAYLMLFLVVAVNRVISPPPPKASLADPALSDEDDDYAEYGRIVLEMDRLEKRQGEILAKIRKRHTPRSRLVTPTDKELPS